MLLILKKIHLYISNLRKILNRINYGNKSNTTYDLDLYYRLSTAKDPEKWVSLNSLIRDVLYDDYDWGYSRYYRGTNELKKFTLKNKGDFIQFLNKGSKFESIFYTTSDGKLNNYGFYSHGNSSEIDGMISFSMKGKIAATGNILSLLNYNEIEPSSHFEFYKLFENCKSLVKAPDLPSTKLGVGCYKYMFKGCENLTTPPVLPSATMASRLLL